MVELATVVMGPYAAQILGDLGADAVKIESLRDPVRTGTPYRHAGKTR